MTDNQLQSATAQVPGEGLPHGETLTILGKLISVNEAHIVGDVKKTNFALIVINAIANIGIERFSSRLEDLGTFQDQVAHAQSAFGDLQKGIAAVEQNAYWNGKNAEFSSALSTSSLSTFEKAVYGLLNGQSTSGFTAQTPRWNQITLSLPRPGGGYVEIQPFTKNGAANGQSWNVMNSFMTSLNNYVFGGSGAGIPLPSSVAKGAAGQHMPIYAAMAISNLQTIIDNHTSYMVDAAGDFKGQYATEFTNGTLFTHLFGAFDANPPLEAIQNMTSLLQSNYAPKGETLLSVIEGSASDGFNGSDLLKPFADMVADFLEKKYGTKSSGAAPSSVMPNISGSTNQYTSISLFSNMNTSSTQGTSELQTQTQKNSATAQVDTTQVNSYDSIGQSIVTAVKKAQTTMINAQTSA